jgi:hypothetical protein
VQKPDFKKVVIPEPSTNAVRSFYPEGYFKYCGYFKPAVVQEVIGKDSLGQTVKARFNEDAMS